MKNICIILHQNALKQERVDCLVRFLWWHIKNTFLKATKMFQNYIKQQERCQDFYLYYFLSFSVSSRTFVTCAVAKYWIFKTSDISTFLLFYFILYLLIIAMRTITYTTLQERKRCEKQATIFEGAILVVRKNSRAIAILGVWRNVVQGTLFADNISWTN